MNDIAAPERHPIQGLLDEAGQMGLMVADQSGEVTYVRLPDEMYLAVQDMLFSAYATGLVKGGQDA